MWSLKGPGPSWVGVLVPWQSLRAQHPSQKVQQRSHPSSPAFVGRGAAFVGRGACDSFPGSGGQSYDQGLTCFLDGEQ